MQGNDDWIVLAVAVCIVIPLLIAMIFYCLTLQRTMGALENPPLPPPLVWLVFVPFIGFIWLIVYACILSAELDKQLAARNVDERAMGITIALAVLMACSIIPLLNILTFLPYLIVWIIHWVKMANLRQRLMGA